MCFLFGVIKYLYIYLKCKQKRNTMKPKLLMEIRELESTRDWEVIKEATPNKRNIASYQRQAKALISEGVHQVHLVVLTEDDPLFQEFYYSDGTMFKMF